MAELRKETSSGSPHRRVGGSGKHLWVFSYAGGGAAQQERVGKKKKAPTNCRLLQGNSLTPTHSQWLGRRKAGRWDAFSENGERGQEKQKKKKKKLQAMEPIASQKISL